MALDNIIPVINVVRICSGPVPAGRDRSHGRAKTAASLPIFFPVFNLFEPPCIPGGPGGPSPTLQRHLSEPPWSLNTGKKGVPCKSESLSSKISLQENIYSCAKMLLR